MYTEIGSDFHWVKENSESNLEITTLFTYLSSYHAIYCDSGRSALRTLLAHVKLKNILLPSYICESVRNCFQTQDVQYYCVDKNFHIVWEDLLKKITTETEAVYLHFFNGEISETYDFDLLTRLKKKYNFLIIEDTTHSLFSNKRCVGDYCICSLRKWFPIPDGGVLYSPRNLSKIEVPLLVNDWWEDRLQAMFQKADYFQGNTGIKPEFRRRFLACEEKLDNQTIPYKMSEKSLNLLKKYDVCTMIKKRLENSKLLEQYISRCPTLQPVAMVGNSQVPLFFTVLVADRDNLRLRLTQKGIYCAVHWPLYEELRHIEEAVFCNRHELSIPIDQRYGKDEMHYIIQTLNEERIKND